MVFVAACEAVKDADITVCILHACMMRAILLLHGRFPTLKTYDGTRLTLVGNGPASAWAIRDITRMSIFSHYTYFFDMRGQKWSSEVDA